MRKLHPVGPREELAAAGRVRRPDGAVEDWTRHRLPGDRHVIRVEVSGAELWHLTLEGRGLPERLELRLTGAGRQVDLTYTFFEDEVLVWRRGAEPASEALAVPPGCRLLWPPVAGRGECLGLVTGEAETDVERRLPCLWLQRGGAAGGLAAAVVEITTARDRDTVRLSLPGRAEMRAALAPDGALARWREAGADWVELGPAASGAP